ncbi:PREDICTED: uncharacterized protein LOC106116099 [Papilio xuthus]|uniref:Uncharacterized protein LOC106116099 n=1 Tax=Papilio xuthus TaxID=66420 RepID=A0AAJ6Z4R9_PAPXU|nr:PREDICTED: uncharacterized protein LOC106116099 [Papilio xuthus]
MSLDVNISEPDEFNCTELHSCIENVAKLNNINDFTYHVEFACGKGENFIANVFRVEIKDTLDCDRKISVIIKTLVNTTRQELFRQLHKREVKAYEEVLSKFEILQSKLDVTNRIVLPGCILSDMKRGNEVLILEDLVSKGYEYETKVNKLKNLEYEQVCLVLRNLAKFHALSIVFELNDKENFIKLKCEFKDVLYQETFLDKSKLRNYYTNCYEDSIQLLDDLEARTKLQYVETKLMQLLRYYTSPRTFNVLCHGDCWINNFLFKQKDNITTDLCFLDFQAMRYSNPATDLVYFLFLSTDSTFRCKYMKDILSVYYESFTTFLKLYDIDSNSVYTKDSFEVDVQEMLPFGVLITLIELRIVTTFEDKEISESTLHLDQCISNESNEEMLLKIRLDDVVKESVLNGTLDRLCEQMKLLN